MTVQTFKQAVKLRMVLHHIDNYLELAKLTGINYKTLRSKINHVEQFRIYEIRALDEVLQFDEREIELVLKGD